MDVPALLHRVLVYVAQAQCTGALPGPPATDAGLQPALERMLLEERAQADPRSVALAGAVASASMGARHLWQDLGLSGRDEVTALLRWGFPTLVARNVQDWKWKRFLFAELGARLGTPGLQPPRCSGCDSYLQCVGAPAAQDQRSIHPPLHP